MLKTHLALPFRLHVDRLLVANGLSQVECDVNASDDATTDGMQVCSSLHFVRVYVRRVIHVIVHNGLTDVGSVLVVVHTFS